MYQSKLLNLTLTSWKFQLQSRANCQRMDGWSDIHNTPVIASQWRIQGGFLVARKPTTRLWFFLNQGVTLFTGTVLHQPLKCSTFGNLPETNSGYATALRMFVTGEHPGDRPHGNSKDATATYIWSRGAVLHQRSRPRQRASSRVSWTIKRDLPADDQPNNVQQVKNQKYIESRHRHGKMAANRGNAADHIRAIEHHFEEEPDSHPFAMCHPRTSTNTCHNYVHRRTVVRYQTILL